MVNRSNLTPEEHNASYEDALLEAQPTGVTSLVGEIGQLASKQLAKVLIGEPCALDEYPNGFDRADDGTLRLTVDVESFEALFVAQ